VRGEQIAAFRLRWENDADKLIPAAFEWDTVEVRESLIHQEAVGVDELANGAVSDEGVAEKEPRLLASWRESNRRLRRA
jgi:hypothetical protein